MYSTTCSLFSWTLLTFIFSFFLFRAHCDYPTIRCNNTNGNYTSADIFSDNLDTILTNITSAVGKSTSGGWFYNLTAGENSGIEKANGIALCRGDTTSSQCDTCINDAATNIRTSCPYQKDVVLWFANCMLRYSNRSIFGSLEETPRVILYNVNNVSDPDSFNQKLGNLLRSLQTKAAKGDNERKYAVGSTQSSNSRNIYALVQCTPDLSSIDCTNCIGNSVNVIPLCCSGKKSIYVMKPSCTLRFETYLFYNEFNPLVVPPPRSPPETSNKGKGSSNGTKVVVVVVITVVSCSAAVFLLLACCLVRRRRRRRRTRRRRRHNVETLASIKEIEDVDSLNFKFDTIKAATNDFSEANKLGRGGFGAVYKGLLPNGVQVAVKRLAKNSGQGETEFKNEVLLLAKLQHRNLVRLQGFCWEKDERILIYEFVPNSSLDYFLLDPGKRGLLDWETSDNIIRGIARGLLYLHEDSRLRIVHRDPKPSNILLDVAMTPKIADFGLARLFQVDQTQGDTSRVAGTYGYMAPEYAFHGFFSAKSDVYSFGVLVLELITGRRSIGIHQGDNSEDIIHWVWRKWKDGTAADVVDETMPTGPWTDIMRVVHIGLLCVQEEAAQRPTMSSVVIMLSSQSITLPVVTHPAYITRSQVSLDSLSEEHSSGVTRLRGSDFSYNDFSSQVTVPR